MFLLTYVLSGPEKLFFQATVFAFVGFYLHWLFTEAPECNSFATDYYVPIPGSWNFPTASDISCQENENGSVEEGDFYDPCLESPENSELLVDSSVICSSGTNVESVISETKDNERSSAFLPGPIIVVDSVLEPDIEAPTQVLNVEINGGETHECKPTKTNKKVGSEAKKAVDADEILAALLLDSSLPTKANSETKNQGKTSRKNNAKCKGKRNAKAKTKTKERKASTIEEIWPEIEAEESLDDSEPATFSTKNPFFLLFGLDEDKHQTFSRSHKVVARKLKEIETESPKIGELSETSEFTSITPLAAEETTASFQTVLPISAFDSYMTSLSATSPIPNTPETPETPRTPGTPEIPEIPETPKTPNTPETLGTPTTPETPETPRTIDDNSFDFAQLIKERKRNGSPSREYRQTFKKMPVLIPLKDTADEWRKASSPSRCTSPVKSGSAANESGWQVIGKRRKQPLTWAQVAADSTPNSTLINSPRIGTKTISKEIKPNVVVLLKRKHVSPA